MTTQVSGVTYMVIERKYAIFPQKSGVITIKPLVLTADVISRGKQNPNTFFNSQMTQRRIVKSNAVTLNVQAIPSTFTGHWLAAEHVELTQTWSDDTSQMKVGEPLTRTIKLVANGSTVGQLPELHQKSVIIRCRRFRLHGLTPRHSVWKVRIYRKPFCTLPSMAVACKRRHKSHQRNLIQ